MRFPDIQGHFDPAIISAHGTFTSGAFIGVYDRPDDGNHGIATLAGTGPWGYYFEAALDNGIYGKSASVQPTSMRLLPCIRI